MRHAERVPVCRAALAAILMGLVWREAAMASPAAGVAAGIASAGDSGVMIQNLDLADPATISVAFYESAGGPVQDFTLPWTAPGGAASVWLPDLPMRRGSYAARVTSDTAIAAIARTDWPGSGGAAMTSSPVPATRVVVPLLVRHFYGQSSIVSIQNMVADGSTTATVDVYQAGAASPVVTNLYTIPPGTSISLPLGGGESEFISLGHSFVGSMFVSSPNPVAVQSIVDIATSDKAVYAFEGVPADSAAPELYVPLFRAEQHPRAGDSASGRIDTGISVSNPGDLPVAVRLTYFGGGGSCLGTEVTGAPITIQRHSSHVFYQGDLAGQGLTANCYGSAVIRSSGGGVVAMVNEAQNLSQTSAAYNAFTANQAASTVALPLYRKFHANGLTTGIAVMNVGAEAAQITLKLMETTQFGFAQPLECPAQECTKVVAPMRTAIFWPGAMASIPSNTYGSATVESTQPVVAIVNDVNVSGVVDMATYGGIGFTPEGAKELALPLLLFGVERP